MSQTLVMRIIAVVTIALGTNYVIWRWFYSVDWEYWWIAVPLILAETYNLIDVFFYVFTIWRSNTVIAKPPAPGLVTVDVFITTYNESVELVVETARAAKKIRYPHTTWILDDGSRPEMEAAAQKLAVGYIKRGEHWKNRPLHAKAGNLNNALMATEGEFLLILDADQIPHPEILDHTLGYFTDPLVALVQTPQWFGNVSTYDPLGSQAPLFYGPIQQGKNGWNAAFFCGSNAILRREALMQLGIVRYVKELEMEVNRALKRADRILSRALRTQAADIPSVRQALKSIAGSVGETRSSIRAGASIGESTYLLQQKIKSVSSDLVRADLHLMKQDLEAVREMDAALYEAWDGIEDIEASAELLATRDLSPLGALEAVNSLLRALDVDRAGEAQPVMPLATVSVTEDMATSMRLHAMGWKSIYHHETLAVGLAPEDLGSMLKQRLRWAQGTMQVMFRENPLLQRGLTAAQKIMYLATMWTYLNGYAAIVYLTAPVVYLCFGILPVKSIASAFFFHFLPFILANQLLFYVSSRGNSTWRGQQYSLALFPIWIKATTSSFANVFFGKPLGFVVTPKTRQVKGNQWGLVKIQLGTSVILIVATFIGSYRLYLGLNEPIGTLVNIAWVIWDIGLMSILIPAVRFRGSNEFKENKEVNV